MRELQFGDSFSSVTPKELGAMESFEFAPRMKSRAAAAITVVVSEQEGQEEPTTKDRLLELAPNSSGGNCFTPDQLRRLFPKLQ